MSPFSVTIKIPYTTSYYWIILTYVLSLIVSELFQIIGQIFAFNRGYLSLTHSFGVNSITHDYEIWSQETSNIALSCGVYDIISNAVSRKKRPKCFSAISPTKLRQFWWNLVHRFLHKLLQNDVNVSHYKYTTLWNLKCSLRTCYRWVVT